MAAGDLISLDDVKASLNIGNSSDDAELADTITTASAMWTRRVGPVAASVFSEWYDGGRTQIALRHTPVISVTSITESWGAATDYTLTEQVLDTGTVGGAFGYSLDAQSGILTRRAAGTVSAFPGGKQNVHVTYTAGYATIPPDVAHAVSLLVLHLWETQRSGQSFPGAQGDAQIAQRSFTWPHRVEEIASTYYVPGIA